MLSWGKRDWTNLRPKISVGTLPARSNEPSQMHGPAHLNAPSSGDEAGRQKERLCWACSGSASSYQVSTT